MALQVFDHPEHVFQSSRCESELAASSTAEEANGHPPELIAIAVHCVSLEGDAPRQVTGLPGIGEGGKFKHLFLLSVPHDDRGLHAVLGRVLLAQGAQAEALCRRAELPSAGK